MRSHGTGGVVGMDGCECGHGGEGEKRCCEGGLGLWRTGVARPEGGRVGGVWACCEVCDLYSWTSFGNAQWYCMASVRRPQPGLGVWLGLAPAPASLSSQGRAPACCRRLRCCSSSRHPAATSCKCRPTRVSGCGAPPPPPPRVLSRLGMSGAGAGGCWLSLPGGAAWRSLLAC